MSCATRWSCRLGIRPWSGHTKRSPACARVCAYLVPSRCCLVFVLLYLSTGSLVKTAIVSLAVPFWPSARSGTCTCSLQHERRRMGRAIALLGVDAQTGSSCCCSRPRLRRGRREGRLRTLADLQATIVEGAAKRLRPKFMTMATTFIGLMPIMWATGTGSDVEADRRADGGRHLHLVRPRARRLPGDLRDLEMALRDEARRAETED